MQEQISLQQKAEFLTRMFMSTLDEWSGTLKLFFIMSTGAVVLFVPLAATSRGPRLALTFLAVSILAFGIASLFCLNLFGELVKFRGLMTNALATGMSETEVKEKLVMWEKEVKRQGRRVQVLFLVGILSASLFVLVAVIIR